MSRRYEKTNIKHEAGTPEYIREYMKLYRLRPEVKQRDKKQNDRWAKLRRAEWTEFIQSIIGNKCEICGYDKCWAAIDIHHNDPKNKTITFGIYIKRRLTEERKERVRKELENCKLFCCRCHREYHDLLNSTSVL
jgi:hypothetical protein